MGRRKTHEEFVAEVKALVGDEYVALGTYVNATTKIMFRHICGYEFPKTPHAFLKRNTNCAKCSGVPRKTTESFAKEITEKYLGEFELVGEYINARTKTLIKHTKCGEIFPKTPADLLSGYLCPVCARENTKKAVTKSHDKFTQEIFKKYGDEFLILGKYKSAKTEIEVKCVKCGNSWKPRASSLLSGHGCPKCKSSKGERAISRFLDTTNIIYTHQAPLFLKKNKPTLYFDFYIQGVIIEYDGQQHFEAIDHFGGEEKFKKTQRNDRIKDKYCADNGIPLIRIPYWDFDNIDAILTDKLLPILDASSTQKQAS